MRRLRVLVLMHPDFVPPDSTDGYTARQINEWKTEYDVVSTLRAAGHDVRPLGAQEEIKPVREEIESFKPHVVFTLLEQFHNEPIYDQHVASYFELMQIAYTGCNPRGLILAREDVIGAGEDGMRDGDHRLLVAPVAHDPAIARGERTVGRPRRR